MTFPKRDDLSLELSRVDGKVGLPAVALDDAPFAGAAAVDVVVLFWLLLLLNGGK